MTKHYLIQVELGDEARLSDEGDLLANLEFYARISVTAHSTGKVPAVRLLDADNLVLQLVRTVACTATRAAGELSVTETLESVRALQQAAEILEGK